MCRTGGRRCPSHSDKTKIAARNARRREQYAKQTRSHTVTTTPPPASTLSPTQAEYFQNSKATVNGVLIPVYHGSSVNFDSFDPKNLGRGNDAWGNGHYFTDQKATAEGYAQESRSETANVKEFYVNLTNPIYMDGKEHMSLNELTFSKQVAVNVLKAHPDAYLQPNDESGEMSFLGDYAPDYWDKETHSKAEIDRMIEKVATEYFSEPSWVELEALYGKEHGAAFLTAMHKETGHDGVIVDFGSDGKHYVAWFSEQMKLTSNLEPDDSATF